MIRVIYKKMTRCQNYRIAALTSSKKLAIIQLC